jgi:hypothetical protein
MGAGFHVGLVKGDSVFVRPYPLLRRCVINGGYALVFKRDNMAFPFPAAKVAKEAERKAVFIGMVGCFFGEGLAHVFSFIKFLIHLWRVF